MGGGYASLVQEQHHRHPLKKAATSVINGVERHFCHFSSLFQCLERQAKLVRTGTAKSNCAESGGGGYW